jgi:hypothetical protein
MEQNIVFAFFIDKSGDFKKIRSWALLSYVPPHPTLTKVP